MSQADTSPSREVKSVEQLLTEGGRFYVMNGECWCDTPLDSWKLMPEKGGYIKQFRAEVD